ncbi:MAG: PIN-like domain-containing protein, partial [Sphaerospermopsis kisseleviana]
MRSVFVGYFRPKDDELSQMWSEGIFVVDANVLLNLYRYSSGTRKELEKALEAVKDRIFITHQAA